MFLCELFKVGGVRCGVLVSPENLFLSSGMSGGYERGWMAV